MRLRGNGEWQVDYVHGAEQKHRGATFKIEMKFSASGSVERSSSYFLLV